MSDDLLEQGELYEMASAAREHELRTALNASRIAHSFAIKYALQRQMTYNDMRVLEAVLAGHLEAWFRYAAPGLADSTA